MSRYVAEVRRSRHVGYVVNVTLEPGPTPTTDEEEMAEWQADPGEFFRQYHWRPTQRSAERYGEKLLRMMHPVEAPTVTVVRYDPHAREAESSR